MNKNSRVRNLSHQPTSLTLFGSKQCFHSVELDVQLLTHMKRNWQSSVREEGEVKGTFTPNHRGRDSVNLQLFVRSESEFP